MTLPHRFVSLAIFAALVVSGCGPSPTAPALTPGTPLPPGAQPNAVQRYAADEPPVVPVPVEGTIQIHGKDGGTLTVGAFTLDVPSGAFNGNANITLRQPDPSQMLVEIEVQPAAKNNFALAATLSANLSGWTRTQIRSATVMSLDPSTNNFTVVPGSTVDLSRRKVLAQFTSLRTSKVKSN